MCRSSTQLCAAAEEWYKATVAVAAAVAAAEEWYKATVAAAAAVAAAEEQSEREDQQQHKQLQRASRRRHRVRRRANGVSDTLLNQLEPLSCWNTLVGSGRLFIALAVRSSSYRSWAAGLKNPLPADAGGEPADAGGEEVCSDILVVTLCYSVFRADTMQVSAVRLVLGLHNRGKQDIQRSSAGSRRPPDSEHTQEEGFETGSVRVRTGR